MNITKVKKRTESITIVSNGETAIVKVYPDEQTPLFEDERRRMIFDNETSNAQLLAYTIGVLVAEWDLVITVEENEPLEEILDNTPRTKSRERKGVIVTRKLDPKNPDDVGLVPLSILNEITKGVSQLNRPGEQKEETSESSFS